ncbi:hypothetical protein F2Q69_00007877 [Brassica cretica]|uniref:DUF223 domain-containing protein n=1 Tax=Brassica cretica TaxID=69181 RepID=A0A8S9P5M1_BRACR|nr:hypothetical protein F2Q69_00007877 [Brassica cretica]
MCGGVPVGFLPLNPSLLPISYISYCKSGKCSSIVEARLMRFWEARNMKRQGDLVDVNATIMQATINSSRLPRFRSRLTAGSMYTISGFDVARCAQSFRLSDSPLMIRFNDLTSFDEITEPVSPLPEEGFRFCNQTKSVGLANTNTQYQFETAEGAFGCFDGVMTKLHNLRAAEAGQMLAAEGVNPEDVTMPLFITDMEGKTLTLITSLHTIRHSKSHTSSLNMSGGNNGDDADMPDGNKFPYQIETGERSSDGDKNVKENLTAAAPKKRTHRPTYATKKAPVA